jgi:hypothetical protein
MEEMFRKCKINEIQEEYRFSMKSLCNALTKDDTGLKHSLIWKGKIPQRSRFFKAR